MSQLTIDLLARLAQSEHGMTLAEWANAMQQPQEDFTRRVNGLRGHDLIGLRNGRYVVTEAGRMATNDAIRDKGIRVFYERAWAALRMRKSATVHDLIAFASRDDAAPSKRYLLGYLHVLAGVGLIVKARGEKPRRFVLLSDPGPIAPRLEGRSGAVWEGNRGLLLQPLKVQTGLPLDLNPVEASHEQ